ncbi:ANTAR domain-containing response regulator [Chengkuizengella marina]|uniref:ANTAR domain-containing protein n=1 Tax=Chengkuizengella marina TaxID=2507566 RepID=A0A6N9Q5M6_9BACL|nr:ANTAR domain-containing protein [Chengkuizengella marina]NBI30122.1 ANTAR domain-containing protein [Chengkuizengella marina]
MLQYFLLINDSNVLQMDEEKVNSTSNFIETLNTIGYRVQSITTKKNIEKKDLNPIDAVILRVKISDLFGWSQKIISIKDVPLIWWCDSYTSENNECKLNLGIDGIIFPQMKPAELHWSFHLCANQHQLKTQWKKERQQLLSKLEERKWIEQAKGIISKMKNISEAEAYEFLRKQAMNDRKRIADVAISIVKVHQLLNE